MALFENYDRRIDQINAVLKKYEIGTLEDAEKLCQDKGLDVAQIADGACEACGTALTAALQQSARHASVLTYCPSCGRILYGD